MNLNEIYKYLVPLLGFICGMLIFGFAAYINWHGGTKSKIVKWIAKKIYRDNIGSETLASGLFMTVTSVLLALGGILVIYSSLFIWP